MLLDGLGDSFILYSEIVLDLFVGCKVCCSVGQLFFMVASFSSIL